MRPEKRVEVDFYFVSDTAGHSTSRNFTDVDELIDAMNAVWTPQANIVFEKGLVTSCTVIGDLGTEVVYSSNPAFNEWDDVVATATGSGDVSVFFIWTLDKYPPSAWGSPEASAFGPDILMQDSITGEDGLTLAHENGHVFGIAGDYSSPSDQLMSSDPTTRGCKIIQSEVDQANPQ